MKRQEEAKVSVLPDDNLIENKYQRVGHIDYGRLSDKITSDFRSTFPGTILPRRWAYKDPVKFVEQFGSGTKWAVTFNYHCLIHNGEYVLRIWTNAGKRLVSIDVAQSLVPLLSSYNPIPIASGSLHKCRPMTHRIRIRSLDEVEGIVSAITKVTNKEVYGLDS